LNKIKLVDPETCETSLVTFNLNEDFYCLSQEDLDLLILQLLALKQDAIDKHIAMHAKMFAREYKSEKLWDLCEDIRVEYRTSVYGETKQHDEFEKYARELFKQTIDRIKQGEFF